MALPACPRCGNNTFEHFIFIHGHSMRAEGGTECIHKRWVRCDACKLPLKWVNGWQIVSEAEFEREVEDHRKAVRGIRENLRVPSPRKTADNSGEDPIA